MRITALSDLQAAADIFLLCLNRGRAAAVFLR